MLQPSVHPTDWQHATEAEVRRIFISHSSQDNDFAEALRERLQSQGHHSLFLDIHPLDGIAAGRDWERELYERIRTCQVMIVVCSRASMASRWCFVEMTHARAMGKPLLALKIDDCELDGVLADRQVVDLAREGEVAFERLFRGIVAAGVDPAKLFVRDPARPVYPGLLSFQEEDAALFFGRDDEISRGLELLTRVGHLGDPRVVMVLGASGTGKSSLVRAGLVPRLRRDGERWIVAGPFRPRTDPAGELASVLEKEGLPELGRQVRGGALADALLALRARSPHPAARVLLVVDQFEELLGTGEPPLFLDQLRQAVDHPDAPVVVLGTMRSDFLDRFQGSGPLLDLRYGVLSLGPLSEGDIREVIEAPANEAELEIEPGLVDALAADAGTPNALPLLAFTLRDLWERYAGDRRLTLREYQVELGGVQEVVGRAADTVLRAARVTREQERALRTAFLAMLRVTDDGKYTRRPVRWKDLPEGVHPLLDRFVQARLLVSDADGEGGTLEVAHERLFDSWARLRGWIAEDAEALLLREELERAARAWEGPRDADQLWRGARVSRARELLAQGTLLLDEVGRRFLDASRHAERTRRQRVMKAVSAFAAVALVLAAIASVSAARARSSAQTADDRARTAEVQRLTALSAQSFAEHQRVLARAQAAGLGPDQKNALLAIAPKYLDQSQRYEAEAARLQHALDAWRAARGRTAAGARDALFTFEALRAREGTAFLVHYGSPGAFRHVLIDGGTTRTYAEVLRPRLDALRSGGKPLPLTLVVATQTDFQHLRGLTDLMDDLQRQPPAAPPFAIGAVWSNAFIPGPVHLHPQLVERQRKARLVAGANALGVPVNAPFTRMVAAPEAGAARVRLDGGLSVTVLGPRVQWLRGFADVWLRDWRERVESLDDPRLAEALSGYDVIEDFADPRIELLASPREIADPATTVGDEQSAVNLGSIILMFELDGKRVLLTADARSDVVLGALAQAGYTDRRGSMDVDVLVVPHGGSDRNVSVDFFRRIRAASYVLSADGTHGNPEIRTFEMIFEARRGDRRPFSIGLTYAPEEYRDDYPLRNLCTLLARERAAGTPFEIITPAKGQSSFGIDLGSRAAFVDPGLRNAVCGT